MAGPVHRVPPTFKRLRDTVEAQLTISRGSPAPSGMVRRPGQKALLAEWGAWLRAPQLEHVILEGWLLGRSG